MKKTWAAKAWIILRVLVLMALCQGCFIQPVSEQPNPTLVAMQAAVAQTATAAHLDNGKVNSLATAQAEATQKSLIILTTQTARAGIRSETKIVEATVAAPMVAELPQYGLDKSGGHVGWVQNPLTLDITGYQQFSYGNDHPETTAADFVLAANITWDTQYGSSGCGYMFRSDGNKNKPNQYMLIATRFGNGHVIFTALANGEITNIHDFYPKTEDRSFQSENGTTNRIAVIARSNIIEIYTNGVKIGEVDTTQPPKQLPGPVKPVPPVDLTNIEAVKAYKSQMKEYEEIIQKSQSSYQTAVKNYMNHPAVFTDGFLGMFAATESGRTVCTFDNAWLWLIEP